MPERISKFLAQYDPATLVKKWIKRMTGQRVLKSTEGLALLKEKDDKKIKKSQEIKQRNQEKKVKKKRVAAERIRLTTGKRAWRSIKVEPNNMSEFSESIKLSTSKEPQEKIDKEDAICSESNVWKNDARNICKKDLVHCACKRWIHENCDHTVYVTGSAKRGRIAFLNFKL